MVTRREFLDTLAVGAAGLAVGTTAKSYAQILGSNARLNFAVIGLNSRAYAHLSSLKANKDFGTHLLRLRCGQQHPAKVRGNGREGNGRGAGNREGLPQDSRAERCRCNLDRVSGSLAHADGDRGIAGGQARVCGEAVQPQSRGRSEMLVQMRSRNTASWCRWARSSGLRRTPSRSSKRFTTV
jgi:hypothetical protein